jgi:hypothetical protein
MQVYVTVDLMAVNKPLTHEVLGGCSYSCTIRFNSILF